MGRLWSSLKILLTIAVVVGIVRFGLTLTEAPRWIVYLASLTSVELLGGIYLAVEAGRMGERHLRLWFAVLVLFWVCQLFYIAGLLYTAATGQSTLYHETARLVGFLGYEPTIAEHIRMHILNWMIIAPTVFTWLICVPISMLTARIIRK